MRLLLSFVECELDSLFIFSTSTSTSTLITPSLPHRPQVLVHQRRHHASLGHHASSSGELQQHVSALHRKQAGADLVSRSRRQEATSSRLLLLSFPVSSFPASSFSASSFSFLPPHSGPGVLGPDRVRARVPVERDADPPRKGLLPPGELAEDGGDDEREGDGGGRGVAREAVLLFLNCCECY